MRDILSKEKGVAFVEYALITAIFLPILLFAFIALKKAIYIRAEESASTVHNMAPANKNLFTLAECEKDSKKICDSKWAYDEFK